MTKGRTETFYIVRVGERVVDGFAYPPIQGGIREPEENELRLSTGCFASLGTRPYKWPMRGAAEFVARAIGGEVEFRYETST